MVKWLLLVPGLLAGCAAEGNEISARWTPASGGLLSGAKEGECVGDAHIQIHALDSTTTSVDCNDGGFELVVPYEAKRVTLDISDDWSDTIRLDVAVEGDVDLGRLYFKHFGDND